jgi:hypothetical protein
MFPWKSSFSPGTCDFMRFGTVAEGTVGFMMVRLSVRMYQCGFHGRHLHEIVDWSLV